MAVTRRYKLGGNISSTGAAADSMVFQRKGKIVAVIWSVLFNSITDNASVQLSISRQAVSEIGAAASGSALTSNYLATFAMQSNFVTSGLAQPGGNLVVPCNDTVQLGDTLYLGATVTGTVAAAVDVLIVVEEAS